LRKIGELERRGHFKSHPDQKFSSLVFSPSSPLPPPPPPFMSTVNDDKLRATFAGAADGEILKSSVAVVPFRCRTFEIGTRRCRCRRRHIMCLKTSQTTLGLPDTIVVVNFIIFFRVTCAGKELYIWPKAQKKKFKPNIVPTTAQYSISAAAILFYVENLASTHPLCPANKSDSPARGICLVKTGCRNINLSTRCFSFFLSFRPPPPPPPPQFQVFFELEALTHRGRSWGRLKQSIVPESTREKGTD
jgi:hypothetical protein